MTVTCTILAEIISELMDDALPPEQKAAAEAHLKRCPPCVAFVQTFRLTVTITRKACAKPPAVPAHLLCRIRDAVAAQQQGLGGGASV